MTQRVKGVSYHSKMLQLTLKNTSYLFWVILLLVVTTIAKLINTGKMYA